MKKIKENKTNLKVAPTFACAADVELLKIKFEAIDALLKAFESSISVINEQNSKYSWEFCRIASILEQAQTRMEYCIEKLNLIKPTEMDEKLCVEYREVIDDYFKLYDIFEYNLITVSDCLYMFNEESQKFIDIINEVSK